MKTIENDQVMSQMYAYVTGKMAEFRSNHDVKRTPVDLVNMWTEEASSKFDVEDAAYEGRRVKCPI